MFKFSRLAVLMSAAALLSAPAFAADGIVVNGQTIPQSIPDFMMNQAVAQGAQKTPELVNNVRERVIQVELLVQEAKKRGLDKHPEVQTRIALAQREILVGAFVSEFARANTPKDEQLKRDYEQLKPQLSGKEYKVRHILVEKEDEAKALVAKLDGGSAFADLATVSKDPGSKDRGGELGWSNPGQFVPAFGQALTKLEKGQYTKTPVKSEFGYHVILVEDTRMSTPPAFEQIKPQLAQRAAQMQLEQLIKELRSKAKVN